MRKLVLAATLTSSLALAGCGAGGITNPFTGGAISAADVQNAAVTACGFLPTAESVAALLTTNPAVASAAAVAQLICSAVLPAKSGKLKGVPMVNGVAIHGKFVR